MPPIVSSSYDVFLSHSHVDAKWVESLARRLEDEQRFVVWLDRWVLVPGKNWQQAMKLGLESTKACALCLSAATPHGWFQQEIEYALNIQSRDPDFRVIPVLMADASDDVKNSFLALRTWADFRQDEEYAFHVLSQGIRGLPIGRWPLPSQDGSDRGFAPYERKVRELNQFRLLGISEQVIVEFERTILTEWHKG